MNAALDSPDLIAKKLMLARPRPAQITGYVLICHKDTKEIPTNACVPTVSSFERSALRSF